jgi:glycosyltransferase involved in cell wall biosynthesis
MRKVSVVIPAKDRASSLSVAIRSAANQQGVATEVIVVDDGSKDNTSEVASSHQGVRVVRNETSIGGAAARNKGAQMATHEFLAFLDSDDEWLPTHLQTSLDHIDKSGADAVFSSFYLTENGLDKEIKFDTVPSHYSKGEAILSNLRFDIRTSTLVFRTSAFREIQFDESLAKHQDWDLAIQFSKSKSIVFKALPTVRIKVDTTSNRMSYKLNHDATFVFLNKHQEVIRAPFRFNFCLKQLFRISRQGGDELAASRYLRYMDEIAVKCGVKERILAFLLRNRLLTIDLVYSAKKMIYRST